MLKKLVFLASLALIARAQVPVHNITLTWTDTSNPSGTQYNVYKSTGPCNATSTFTKLNQAPITGLTYNDNAVVPFIAYCYYITATNGTIESKPSVQAGATALPFSPASLTLTAN